MTPNQRIHHHETANRALTNTAQQTAQLAQFCNHMASPHPNTTHSDIASDHAKIGATPHTINP